MPKPGPSLDFAAPTLAAEFHENLNGGLTPADVSSTSSAIVWWKGACGHEWQQRVNLRVLRGYGCVYCSGKAVLRGFNDLMSQYPEVASQWDHGRNTLGPEEVSAGSSLSVTWICPKAHSYEASIVERIRQYKKGRISTCPFCLNRKVASGENDLLSVAPALAAEWDYEKNQVNPSTLASGTLKKFWWICPSGHSFDMSPSQRVKQGQNCPFCSGKRVLAGFNDLLTRFPDVATTWDPDKNTSTLNPSSVTPKSGRKFFWLCEFGHSYEATVAHRTEGKGCPICAGKHLLPGFNDLATLRPQLAQMFSGKNNLHPSNVLNGTGEKYLWECLNGHEWSAAPTWVKGCPVCANQKLLVGFNDLETVDSSLAAQWNTTRNGSLKPRDVIAGTGRHYWWVCANGHEWKTSPNNRRRTGCPSCSLGGYDQSRAGILYFLRHKQLAARKIGITNTDSYRLERLKSEGWTVISLWQNEDGLWPLNVETKTLKWLRKDLGIPPFLHSGQMKNTGGWTETFAEDEPSDFEIISFIESHQN